jgi:uncharacterized protein
LSPNSTRYLLDVNVLIALIDPVHVFHDRAHAWFDATGQHGWATCPLTENAVVRIVGSPRYANSPGTPAAVAVVLVSFCNHLGHEFWPDDISLLSSSTIDRARMLNSSQVTDSYLLALALHHNGRLASLDARMVTDAVPQGSSALHLIR